MAAIDPTGNTFRNLVGDEWIITMVVSPDGETIYGSSRIGDSISVVDVASETVTDHVFVGFPSIGTALHPNGSTLFSTHPQGDLVAVIDTATATLVDTIDVSEHDVVSGIAVHPAGTTLYINSGQRPRSAAPGFVTVIDLNTLTEVDTIMVGSNPNSIGHYITPMGFGGAITGVGTRQVTCENQTTGSRIRFPLNGGTSWDCSAAGLEVSPGDSIQMILPARARDSALLVAGGVTGDVDITSVRCQNRTTT